MRNELTEKLTGKRGLFMLPTLPEAMALLGTVQWASVIDDKIHVGFVPDEPVYTQFDTPGSGYVLTTDDISFD